MHVMTTLENAHWLDRGEHVLCTDGTIAVESILEADMVIED